MGIFCPFGPMPDQKTMRRRCLGGFSIMLVTKHLIFPVKKGFFAQKRPNLAQNWQFWPLLAHLVPCWWGGWWLLRAGCISQDTYLLYIKTIKVRMQKNEMSKFLVPDITHSQCVTYNTKCYLKLCHVRSRVRKSKNFPDTFWTHRHVFFL